MTKYEVFAEHQKTNKNQVRQTGNYYYGARYYNPKWSTWLSVDPLAEEAPDWTPYRYGFHNPLKFIDPTGMLEDDYGMTSDGTIYLIRETDDDFDRLIFVNDEGNETDRSIKVQEGILEDITCGEVEDIQNSTIVPTQTLDVSKMTTEDSKKLFEFIADNTNNEFSFSIFSNSKSYISTSFINNAELSASNLIKINDYKLKYHAHNHPNGDLNPSPGDINSAAILFGRKKIEPVFKTYYSGEYQTFNHNSTSFEMEEIILSAPIKKKKP